MCDVIKSNAFLSYKMQLLFLPALKKAEKCNNTTYDYKILFVQHKFQQTDNV